MSNGLKQLNWPGSRVHEEHQRVRGNVSRFSYQLEPHELPTAISGYIVGLLQRLEITDFKLDLAKFHATQIQTVGKEIQLPYYWHPFVAELIGVNDMLIYELAHYYGYFYDTARFNWANRHIFRQIRTQLKSQDSTLGILMDTQKTRLEKLRNMRNYIIHRGTIFPTYSEVNITEHLGFSDSLSAVSNPPGTTVSETFLGPMGADDMSDRYIHAAGFTSEADFALRNFYRCAIEWFNDIIDIVDELREYCVNHSPLFDRSIAIYKP